MTTFHHAVDNSGSTVTVLRSIGGNSLTVSDGTSFGSTFPQYVSIQRLGTDPLGLSPIVPVTVLEATARSGNILTISGPAAGWTDAACQVGQLALGFLVADHLQELQDAFNGGGAQGPQGRQGATGGTGVQGNQGTTGGTGPQGNQGTTGGTGVQGNQGTTGGTGPQGFQGVSGIGVPTDAQTGTTYTLVLTDAGKLVSLTNASAITLTIPPHSSVAFAADAEIELLQLGAGQVTISPGSGVTISSYGAKTKLAGQYAAATVKQISTDSWVSIGNLA